MVHTLFSLSFLQLTCVPLEPGFPSADWVRWLHNGRRLHLKGRKGSFVLAVDRATAADAGNYTCIPHSSQVMAKGTQYKKANNYHYYHFLNS